MKSNSKTSSSNIFECSASYYNPVTKKWDEGNFTLTQNHVQFVCDSEKDVQFHLCLPLSTITSIEKRQSNFIYPSLVISIASEKHWFGSFSNRDVVYNLLELFWRDSLFSKPYRKFSPPKVFKTNSSLGKELLEILTESKNTLIGTANSLSDQSRQLYEAEEAVEDLNTDLTTAEEAIKSLSLPLTLANLTNNNEDIKTDPTHRFKVTFSFSNDDMENKTDWEKGLLIFSNDVIILKTDENIVMQVTKDELEALQVISPWELCITYAFSGLQKSCYFMCPLSRLLKCVSCVPHYKEKLIYVDDDSSVYDTASCSSFGSAVTSPSSPLTCAHSTENKSNSQASSRTQSKEKNQETSESKSNTSETQANESGLTDEEIQEINRILQSLQTIAADVGREQVNQMERIDAIVENMEKTDIRMKNSSKNVKKKS